MRCARSDEAVLEASRRAEAAMKGASYMVPTNHRERERMEQWDRARRQEREQQQLDT